MRMYAGAHVRCPPDILGGGIENAANMVIKNLSVEIYGCLLEKTVQRGSFKDYYRTVVSVIRSLDLQSLDIWIISIAGNCCQTLEWSEYRMNMHHLSNIRNPRYKKQFINV